MSSIVSPPDAQPLRRVLWFGLEPHYWLYIGGALLFGGFLLLTGLVPWWVGLLALISLVLLSTLLALPWNGLRLDSWLRLLVGHLLSQAAPSGAARWQATREGEGKAQTAEGEPPAAPWWDEPLSASADEEASVLPFGWESAAPDRPSAAEADAAFDYQAEAEDALGAGRPAVSERFPRPWSSRSRSRPAEPPRSPGAARAAGLAWHTAGGFAYDPEGLFLLDQHPLLLENPAPQATWATPVPPPHLPRWRAAPSTPGFATRAAQADQDNAPASGRVLPWRSRQERLTTRRRASNESVTRPLKEASL